MAYDYVLASAVRPAQRWWLVFRKTPTGSGIVWDEDKLRKLETI